jgi:hypothetical protein
MANPYPKKTVKYIIKQLRPQELNPLHAALYKTYGANVQSPSSPRTWENYWFPMVVFPHNPMKQAVFRKLLVLTLPQYPEIEYANQGSTKEIKLYFP